MQFHCTPRAHAAEILSHGLLYNTKIQCRRPKIRVKETIALIKFRQIDEIIKEIMIFQKFRQIDGILGAMDFIPREKSVQFHCTENSLGMKSIAP